MKSFQWGNEFETGIGEVDHQHQQLVDLINQLSDCLDCQHLALEDVEAIFTELVNYTQYHFTEEQNMMARINIDHRHLNSHIQSHHDFVQELTWLHSRIAHEGTEAAEGLLDFLINWLAYHILDTDQNMARQVSLIEGGMTPSEAYEEEEHRCNQSTGPLLTALKYLFHQASDRNKKLLSLNETLEQKVEERTQALLNANKELEHIALTDILTQLPNRRHAMQQLTLLWKETLTLRKPLSCIMIDADHFKQINDTHGHEAGDKVLQELARKLEHSVRTDDIVCRLGGDEFLIICPHTDHEGAMIAADTVHKKMSKLKVDVGSGAWLGSISVGVATYEPTMKTQEELLKSADQGVYAAKEAGKNCVRCAQ